MPLDLFSIQVMTLITMLVVTMAALLAWMINRQVAGLQLFALGLLALAAGALFGIVGVFQSAKGIVLACDACLLGGMVTVAGGVRVFRGFPTLPRQLVGGAAALTWSLIWYCLFSRNNPDLRAGVLAAVFALLTLDAAVSMFRRVPVRDRLIYWPTGFAFAFASLYLAARAALSFSGTYAVQSAPLPFDIASTICADIAYLSCVVGLLLACNAQLRYEAQKLALFDSLTGLPNRRFIQERLLETERRSRRSGERFGLIYLDLDGFKVINDTLGHCAGDDLLRKVSAAMGCVIRASDFLGRIGGDEFVVVAERIASRGEIEVLAAQIESAVAAEPVPGDFALSLRVSCGLAVFPDDASSGNEVMRAADTAMYHAKRRNQRTDEQSNAAVA